MGNPGGITSTGDLPSDPVLIAYLRGAAALNASGERRAPARPAGEARKSALRAPAILAAALRRNAKARKTFEGFSPSQKRE